MVQKPPRIERVDAGAKDLLVEVQLAIGDHDAPAFPQDEAVDFGVFGDVAHGGGERAEAQGFQPGAREEGTVLVQVGDARLGAEGERGSNLGAQEGDEGGVVDDVGQHPEAGAAGVGVDAVAYQQLLKPTELKSEGCATHAQ